MWAAWRMRAFAMSVSVLPFSRSANECRKKGVENAVWGCRFAKLCMRKMESLPVGSVSREMMDGWNGLKYG